MKNLLFLCGAAALGFALPAQIRAQTNPPASLSAFCLQWDQPTNTFYPDLNFTILSSTDLTVPFVNWPVLTNAWWTNLPPVTNATATTNPAMQSYRITITTTNTGQLFFTVHGTNFAGEGFFSVLAMRPAASQSLNPRLYQLNN